MLIRFLMSLSRFRDPFCDPNKVRSNIRPEMYTEKFIRGRAEDGPPTGWKSSWEAGSPPGAGSGAGEDVGDVHK